MTDKDTVKLPSSPDSEPVGPVAKSTAAQPEAWVAYLTPFATAIGKTLEEVTSALVELVGPPGLDAIELLQDAEYTPDDDIAAAVGAGVPKAKFKKAIAGLRTKAEVAQPVTASVPMGGTATLDVLPQVPSDEAWLAALKVGGVLKISKEAVTGVVSAALASRVGLYDLPTTISAAMEEQAKSLEEPVGEDYYKLQALLTRRSYAEIFAAMPGVDGRTFATEKRKNELLQRLNERLWQAFANFHSQVDAWQQQTQAQLGVNSQYAMAQAFQAWAAGTPGTISAAFMAAPIPTDAVRDAADAVIDCINGVFAGTGIPTALALAYDAQQIRAVLENPALPAQVGAMNREQMLRKLGVALSSDYPRLERSLKQYALAIIELQNVSPGSAEQVYIMALWQLGTMIQFDKLATGSSTRVVRDAGSTRF